ncbi:MAG: hypothetical protein WCF90_06240 [Methanomicrobiales archaeon]
MGRRPPFEPQDGNHDPKRDYHQQDGYGDSGMVMPGHAMYTASGMVWFTLGTVPANVIVAPNLPGARPKVITAPETRPFADSGRVTNAKIRSGMIPATVRSVHKSGPAAQIGIFSGA